MLCLLLCLSALSLISDAAPVSGTAPVSININDCPYTWYGQAFTSVDVVAASTGSYSLKFNGNADRVIMPPIAGSSVNYEILQPADLTAVAATVESSHSTLTNLECALKVTLTVSGGTVDIYLMNYGAQAAVSYSYNAAVTSPSAFVFVANGVIQDSLSLSTSSDPSGGSEDVTGCREGSTPYKSGATITTDNDLCREKKCGTNGASETLDMCTSTQGCLKNGKCGDESFCSVVGPSIVTLSSSTTPVPDFCTYFILSPSSALKVLGYFRERRLKDTPFLALVDVITESGTIKIFQGNYVEVDDHDVTSSLSSTASTHVGASITKDTSGVTVEYLNTGQFKTIIFFDGTLLHITHYVESTFSTPATGFCGGQSSPDSKNSAESPSGCDTVPSDALGDNIVCGDVETRCTDLLSTLGSTVVITPFVTACANNLLCNYPDVDDIACHFLDAYARSSKLSLPSDSDCGVSECVNHKCVEHEFCAISSSGAASCFCRSQNQTLNNYRTSERYGEVASCSEDTASVAINTCLLNEIGVDYTALHLEDSSCTGEHDDDHLLTFTFTSSNLCGGTTELDDNNNLVLDNQISNAVGLVSHQQVFSMDFSCSYTSESLVSSTASFRIRDGTVTLSYTTEDFTFNLVLGLYTDLSGTMFTSSTEVALNQDLYVKLKAEDIDSDTLALVIDNCWTTTESASDGANKYNMMTDKCPAPDDGSVTSLSNGQSLESTFKFQAFVYPSDPSADIYLHCQVSMCVIAGGNCQPTC